MVRKINQGLSSRVKTEEAYANTRLNNAEFGNACKIASAAFNSVNSRKRGMMRNFAVSAMAKVALEDIKQGTGAWGARVPATEMDTLICELLEKHAKGGIYDGMFGTFDVTPLDTGGTASIDINFTDAQVQALKDLGIDGMYYVPSKCLAGEILVDGLPRLYAGHGIGAPTPVEVASIDPSDPEGMTIGVSSPSSVGMSQAGYTFAQDDTKHGFYVVLTILPYRTEGSNRHTLQEYCTFVAIPLGQIPE